MSEFFGYFLTLIGALFALGVGCWMATQYLRPKGWLVRLTSLAWLIFFLESAAGVLLTWRILTGKKGLGEAEIYGWWMVVFVALTVMLYLLIICGLGFLAERLQARKDGDG